MTEREALKLALEHIEGNYTVSDKEVITAIKEALAQPEFVLNGIDCSCGRKWRVVNNTLTASAQPEQEPVAYLYKNIEDYEKHVGFECNDAFIVGWNMARTTERMLSNYFYTAPPQRKCCCGDSSELGVVHRADAPCFHYEQREWQGLTQKEVMYIVKVNTDPWCDTPETDGYSVAEMVEAKLKEKNA